jgi:hypothetical protein
MTSNIRGWFLIIGSIIAFIGFTLPVLYGVSYSPPAHSAAASINIAALPGFGGAFSFAGGGVYNGFSGPVDFHDTLIAIILSFGLGLFALKFDIEHGIPWVKYLHHTASALAQVFIVGQFIWKFRSGGTPPEIIQKFIADLGGTPSAIAASHYLSGLLGGGTLILLFGFLVGTVGYVSWWGCLLLFAACLVFAVLLLYTKATTGAW